MDSSRLKDTKSGASAIEAGNEFQKGMVRGNNYTVWLDLVRAEAWVTYGEVGMSTMSFMIL